MAGSSRSLARATIIVIIAIAVAACSRDSTSSTSRSIVGHVTISQGDARIPAENLVGAHGSAQLGALALRRARVSRINVIFRQEALGTDRLGAMSVRTMERARQVGDNIRARLAAYSSASQFTVSDVSPAIGAARLRLHDASQRDAIMATLRADPAVAAVDMDRVVSRGAETRVHLSAALKQQLLREARSSSTVGTKNFRFAGAGLSRIQYWNYNIIDAPRAWALPDTGSAAVTVAVIDDGINPHPDISPNLDLAGAYDFVSDDSQEFGPPVPNCGGGPDFTNTDGDGTPGPDADPTMPVAVTFDAQNGCFRVDNIANHGLHVSGTIGATNNSENLVTGVNWNVRIRMIRALGIDGFGYDFDIAQAVLYAAGLPAAGAGGQLVIAPNRAPIINMSLGGESDSTLGAAVAAAINAGSVIIASAGNDASSTPNFPASYPQVISVAALGADGELASYSSSNAFVSLVAPGGDFRFDLPGAFAGGTSGVLSTVWDFVNDPQSNEVPGPDYAFYTGTSMAAPHVSGVAALVLAANPGLTGQQLRDRLTSTAVDMGPPGPDARYGFGRVDAYNAITGTQGPPMNVYVIAINASTGAVAKTVQAGSDLSYTLAGLDAGSYYVVAGQDEDGDGVIGFPGRRYGWANGGGVPVPVEVGTSGAVDAQIPIGLPVEQLGVEGRLFVGGWVYGALGTPNATESYAVTIPTSGVYSFETSGAIGSCGFALELNTALIVTDSHGTRVGSNDNTSSSSGHMSFPGQLCSYVSAQLSPGTYTVQVTAGGGSAGGADLFNPGTYRLQVRSGT